MMRTLILGSALVFFTLVGGEGLFIANSAYADCCMCGTCRYGCTCPGIGSCAKCNMPESIAIISWSDGIAIDVNVRGIREALSPMLLLPVNTDRLTKLAEARQCAYAQKTFRLKLMDAIDTPILASRFFESNTTQESLVALSTTLNEKN